jgi:uncharacterized repeat protein (TIGR03803 family)
MHFKKLSIRSVAVGAILATLLGTDTRAVAQQETLLHSFNYGSGDGWAPLAGLVFDSGGNLYGTTQWGGTGACSVSGTVVGCGTIFELAPAAGGGWTEKILHEFSSTGPSYPAAGLIFDRAGNLYGTTSSGGKYNNGTAFELIVSAGGKWTLKVLHSFTGADGQSPIGNLIFDRAGNLYGMTSSGGTYNCGTAFELTPLTNGGWKEKVLHSFLDNGTDGFSPRAGMIFDARGNLYGTTSGGGGDAQGTVFELTPTRDGLWGEKVLHSFVAGGLGGNDGYNPRAGLIFDAAGNLYGTTLYGGAYNQGTVLELTLLNGTWTSNLLHSFDNNGTDGYYSIAGLTFDAGGNLYGTTSDGSLPNSYYGTLFELTPTAGGSWTEAVLHYFDINAGDGASPVGSLIFECVRQSLRHDRQWRGLWLRHGVRGHTLVPTF